ncbi:uncharacterized protein APUU_41600S [Aspergillus puulaauensis]|uniref:Amino acid permease/ SLC12A domain-containing protein n=1 Tax=Aspergillus puulaauensis TaxID=1220207 RepID=A0A7R7XP61_9EURO|nr:uncharacterized protein APUU_41600S [Aspergillus puulaauensis]BCS25156.1 hypothetical protein APUU_41600S [Aspergillus puulaauensis]
MPEQKAEPAQATHSEGVEMQDTRSATSERTQIPSENEQRTLENAGTEYREKQQLDRYLSFLASLAFSATLLASWETTGAGLLAGLYNGGPVAVVYGLIVSIVGNLAIAMSLAELASVHPTAGAQYHWTYVLAPCYPRFLSFFQGWITVWYSQRINYRHS